MRVVRLIAAVVLWLILPLVLARAGSHKRLEGCLAYRFGMSVAQVQPIMDGQMERSAREGIPGVVDYFADNGRLRNTSGSIDIRAGLCLSFYNGKLSGIIIEMPVQSDLTKAKQLASSLRSDLLSHYDESLVQRDSWYPDRYLAALVLRDEVGNALFLGWDHESIQLFTMTGGLLGLDPECAALFEEDSGEE